MRNIQLTTPDLFCSNGFIFKNNSHTDDTLPKLHLVTKKTKPPQKILKTEQS